MQKKNTKKHAIGIRQAGLLPVLLLLLCGCTKKDEILILSETGAEKAGAADAVLTEDAVPGVPDGESRETEPSFADGKEEEPSETGVICVHVCGAVAAPGVYELQAGSRVYEAVQSAGGFADNAEQNYVNQAQVLEDGIKLVIPTWEEAAAAKEQESAASGKQPDASGAQIGIVGGEASEGQGDGRTADGKININTATTEQLCEIPGVGATRAAAIAAYREAHGSFEKPEDIMKVSGIKEGMYEKIKDSISVN